MSLPQSPAWRLAPLATMVTRRRANHARDGIDMLVDRLADGLGLLVNLLEHLEGEGLRPAGVGHGSAPVRYYTIIAHK